MPPTKPSRLTKERIAVSLAFFVNGSCFALLACRIPDIQRQVGLDEAQLGMALLSSAIGALIGVANAGRVCARNGSHRVAILAGFAFCFFTVLLSFAPSLWALIAVFVCFGVCGATMDVAMNVNGVAVEKLQPKPIMSSLHGMFSIGGLVMAGIGWLVVKCGVSVQVHFVVAAVALAATLVWIAPRLLPATPDPDHVPPPLALPEKAVLVVGFIGFCAFLCEGAMGDWSAIYLQKGLLQTAAYSTLGFFAFSFTMTATRFWGDAVLHRWGPAATLRVCGLITAVGLGAALWTGLPWLTLVGFACVGLGMATVAPIAFSLGGRIGGDNPDHAISSIATMSYTAFMVGPALIGFMAKSLSLRGALVIVVVLALTIVLLAGFASKK